MRYKGPLVSQIPASKEKKPRSEEDLNKVSMPSVEQLERDLDRVLKNVSLLSYLESQEKLYQLAEEGTVDQRQRQDITFGQESPYSPYENSDHLAAPVLADKINSLIVRESQLEEEDKDIPFLRAISERAQQPQSQGVFSYSKSSPWTLPQTNKVQSGFSPFGMKSSQKKLSQSEEIDLGELAKSLVKNFES